MSQPAQKCALCGASASASVHIVSRYHSPLCPTHHEAYRQEAAAPSSTLLPDKSRPTLSALFILALGKLDSAMAAAEKREETRSARPSQTTIYITYHEGRYELWLGPEWHPLEEAALPTIFLPHHAAKIIAHKPLLIANPTAALKFTHPFGPDLSPQKLKPDQLSCVGLADWS